MIVLMFVLMFLLFVLTVPVATSLGLASAITVLGLEMPAGLVVQRFFSDPLLYPCWSADGECGYFSADRRFCRHYGRSLSWWAGYHIDYILYVFWGIEWFRGSYCGGNRFYYDSQHGKTGL